MKIARSARAAAVLRLLQQQPDCYFTHGQIAKESQLKPTPYLRGILWELAESNPHVHRISVTAVNGRPAWGFYYSQQQQQLALDLEQCP